MTGQPERDLRAQVKAALTTARISQAEAARQLDLSTKHMSQMLTGRATLTLDWADRILTLCGMTLAVVAAPAANQSRPTQPRIALDNLTSDALDQLYADLDRYEEVVGELNEANTGLQREVANLQRDLRTQRWYAEDRLRTLGLQRQRAETAETTVTRVRQAVDAGPVGACCARLIHAALKTPPAT